jgi:intracellular septation protein A
VLKIFVAPAPSWRRWSPRCSSRRSATADLADAVVLGGHGRGLGGLTIWLHNEGFIKMKPTLYYALVAGCSSVRPATAGRCSRVLGHLSGARRSRLAQAHAQLGLLLRLHGRAQRGGVAQQLDRRFWLGFKVWGALPLTFLFARPTSRCCCATD